MSFLELCENIEDNRTDINKHYDLLDIIFLTMSAVLSGAKGWKAIHIFGVAQLKWLSIGPSKIANIGCWTSHSEKMKARYMLRMGRKTWPYSGARYLI